MSSEIKNHCVFSLTITLRNNNIRPPMFICLIACINSYITNICVKNFSLKLFRY